MGGATADDSGHKFQCTLQELFDDNDTIMIWPAPAYVSCERP